jgi:hypothetical protein
MIASDATRKALGRFVVLLCVAALVSGDLLRGLHLLTSRHVLCAEHGELIHADGDSQLASRSAPADGAAAEPGAPISHHHEHCDLAAARSRNSATAARFVAVSVSDPFASRLYGVPEHTVLRELSVLDYAPKQSPPL